MILGGRRSAHVGDAWVALFWLGVTKPCSSWPVRALPRASAPCGKLFLETGPPARASRRRTDHPRARSVLAAMVMLRRVVIRLDLACSRGTKVLRLNCLWWLWRPGARKRGEARPPRGHPSARLRPARGTRATSGSTILRPGPGQARIAVAAAGGAADRHTPRRARAAPWACCSMPDLLDDPWDARWRASSTHSPPQVDEPCPPAGSSAYLGRAACGRATLSSPCARPLCAARCCSRSWPTYT